MTLEHHSKSIASHHKQLPPTPQSIQVKGLTSSIAFMFELASDIPLLLTLFTDLETWPLLKLDAERRWVEPLVLPLERLVPAVALERVLRASNSFKNSGSPGTAWVLLGSTPTCSFKLLGETARTLGEDGAER